MEGGVPYRRGMKGKTKFKAESSPIGERVTSHERISVPALISPFKKLVFTAMKIHFVSEKTVSASLTLIFATDTGITLTAPLTWVAQTVFFVVTTLRSVTEIHCFIGKQHCFVAKQHCCAMKMVCFVTDKVRLYQRRSAAKPGDTLLYLKATFVCRKTTLLFHEATLLRDDDTSVPHGETCFRIRHTLLPPGNTY